MEPMKLSVRYDQTIWAGNKLAEIRKRKWNQEGTSWELSAHPTCESIIENGLYKDRKLQDVITENKQEMLGTDLPRMLRIAILDAAQSLSIQVHPDDAYALKNENDEGKTESWYILDADPDASLVAGSDFTFQKEIQKAIQDDAIEPHLHHIPVKRGDFIAIPSGTLHALGAGILAIEIGTNSNTTYRFYDFHRKGKDGKERQLHITRSLDVVRLGTETSKIHAEEDGKAKIITLADLPEFTVTLVDVEGTCEIQTNGKNYLTLSNVGKDASYIYNGEAIPLEYTRTLFIPATAGKIIIQGNTRILIGKPKGHYYEHH